MAQVARELASHLRLKQERIFDAISYFPGGEGTGFSSEIETTHICTPCAFSMSGEGTGFSSEIETTGLLAYLAEY